MSKKALTDPRRSYRLREVSEMTGIPIPKLREMGSRAVGSLGPCLRLTKISRRMTIVLAEDFEAFLGELRAIGAGGRP